MAGVNEVTIPDESLVGRHIDVLRMGEGPALVVTKLVPTGPTGLWNALVRAGAIGETEQSVPTFDLLEDAPHLGYLARLAGSSEPVAA
jgi:hypothetical protein